MRSSQSGVLQMKHTIITQELDILEIEYVDMDDSRTCCEACKIEHESKYGKMTETKELIHINYWTGEEDENDAHLKEWYGARDYNDLELEEITREINRRIDYEENQQETNKLLERYENNPFREIIWRREVADNGRVRYTQLGARTEYSEESKKLTKQWDERVRKNTIIVKN